MIYILIFLIGSFLHIHAMEDGFNKIEIGADGTIVRTWENGQQWITGPNGSFEQYRYTTGEQAGVVETRYKSGEHTMLTPKGKQVHTFPDGTTINEVVIDMDVLKGYIRIRNQLIWRAILFEYHPEATHNGLTISIFGQKIPMSDVYYQLHKLRQAYARRNLEEPALTSYFREQEALAHRPIPTDNPEDFEIGNMLPLINQESLRVFKAKALMSGRFPLVLWAVFTPHDQLCKAEFRSRLHELLREWKVTK